MSRFLTISYIRKLLIAKLLQCRSVRYNYCPHAFAAHTPSLGIYQPIHVTLLSGFAPSVGTKFKKDVKK